MKLYNENELRKAILFSLAEDATMDKILNSLTPIELPSDDEINNYADFAFPYAEKIGEETYTAYRGFKIGVKWMRDKIQGGNK